MYTESSTLEQCASPDNEAGLSLDGAHSTIGARTTGNSSSIAATATAATTSAETATATTKITTVAAKTAAIDGTEVPENDVNSNVLPLRFPCSTCENIQKRPWQVVKYKEMGTVLKQCTKMGNEGNIENIYDHICLSGK